MGQWQRYNLTSQTRAKRSALSQQVTTRHQQTDAHESITKQDRNYLNDPQKNHRLGTVKPAMCIYLVCSVLKSCCDTWSFYRGMLSSFNECLITELAPKAHCIHSKEIFSKAINKFDTVKPVLSSHSKIHKTKLLLAYGNLMKVESIAECFPLEQSAVLLTCIKRYSVLKTISVFFWSGRLRPGLLYIVF